MALVSVTTGLHEMPPSPPASELECGWCQHHWNVVNWGRGTSQGMRGMIGQQQGATQTGKQWVARRACGRPKVNALEGGRTEALFKFLEEFMKDQKSQAGSRQEDSSFQKVRTSVVVSQALEEMCRVGKPMGAQALEPTGTPEKGCMELFASCVGTESLIVCSGVMLPPLVRDAWSQSPSQA